MLFFTMDYRSSPETLLINKSKKGDTKAFEELMLRSKDYLASWIHNKTGSENDTEEILHITYIKCWKNIKKFQEKSRFKTWACTISRNLFIDEWRRKRKKRETSIEECPNAYNYSRTSDNEGYNSLNRSDLKKFLENVLDDLPKIHRDVLFSFAVEGLTYEEISKKLNCSVGTIMSRLYYARKKAQKIISRHKEWEL
jgi:RNA polymerase sigma-70 factor (ECF subfamily)